MYQNDLLWYRENNFPETVIDSVDEIISRVEKYYGITFEGLFISNTKSESHEEYPSLWLYNNEYIVESKNFLSEKYLDIDLARYKGNVQYVNITSFNFRSLEAPTTDSKMKLMISIGNNISCTIEAVGVNCSKLNELAKKFIEEQKLSK